MQIHNAGFRSRGKISSHLLPTLNIRAELLLTGAQKGTGSIHMHTYMIAPLWSYHVEILYSIYVSFIFGGGCSKLREIRF